MIECGANFNSIPIPNTFVVYYNIKKKVIKYYNL